MTSIGAASEYARAFALQNDGKIVVAGHVGGVGSDFLIIRLTSSGAYDSTFGTAGIVMTSFNINSTDETNDMVIQPDRKILIAGWTSTGNKDIALLRFNADGSADSTFGFNGKVQTNINNTIQEAHDVGLQPDGKIIVAGFTSSPLTANDVAVFRYKSNGSLDSSFANNGIAVPVLNANDDDAAFGMVLQPDGKIVTAGYTYTNFTYADNLIVRFDSTGNLDTSFNSTGVVVANNGNSDHLATDVMLQPDGKIVITGRAFRQFTLDFMLARFSSNGIIDPSFGNAGYAYTNIALENDFTLASLMQPDGKIVVTGYYTDSGIENFLLARYGNDSIFTGINETDNDHVLIYPQAAADIYFILSPNPSLGTFTIITENKIKNGAVQVLNVQGSILFEEKIVNTSTKEIHLTLSAGIYFVKVNDGEKEWIQKLIIR